MDELISIYKWGFGGVADKKNFLISGPCSAETEQQVVETALSVAQTGANLFRAGVWKPRTRPNSFEGVGEAAFAWLRTARQLTGLPFCIEIASARHVEIALKNGADVLWIGARTTVNPFAVQEIADALRGIDIPVMVKNPVNPDLELWIGAIERLYQSGLRRIAAVHRGFSVYQKTRYRNEPLWEIATELRRRIPALSIITDPSHIAGDAALLAEVAQTACDIGTDGFMFETHCQPAAAWSDAKQQIRPETLSQLLLELSPREESSENSLFQRNLAQLRSEIDRLDYQTLDLLSQRMALVRLIGEFKREHNIAIVQMARWAEIFSSRSQKAEELQIGREFISELLRAIHKESISQQTAILQKLVEAVRK
jgi:chorismate mutase